MISNVTGSGGAAGSATGGNDNPVVIASADPTQFCASIIIVNNGPNAGFFSIDGWQTWCFLPAAPSSFKIDTPFFGGMNVQIRRVPSSGNDMSGVYFFAAPRG